MTRMAAEKQTSTNRARQVAANGDWRSRVHTPAETDPKKRTRAIRRAASRIKTTARIDTITLGRD
jgi:hypothetical protein